MYYQILDKNEENEYLHIAYSNKDWYSCSIDESGSISLDKYLSANNEPETILGVVEINTVSEKTSKNTSICLFKSAV